MAPRLVLAAAVTSLALAGSSFAAQSPHGPPAAKAAQKKCTGGRVPVTVGKKTTCKPLAKALPKPRKIDLRLAHLQEALKLDPAKMVGGEKRKRAKTLQSGFGAAGKRAQKKLLRVLPKALKFIDRKREKARSSHLLSAPALASAGCSPGEAGPIGHTGGASVGLLGNNGGYIDAPAGGGIRVRITFYSCGGVSSFRIPECPTADGSVDSGGSGDFSATIEIREGNRLASRQSSVFEEKAKAHGEVGADAKLKSIELEHTMEIFIVATGVGVVRGGVERKVKITMPGGSYNAAGAGVRYFGDSISSDSGANSFASTAEAAIGRYREAEPRWSTFPPHCADPVFSPESNTLKLRKGEQKQLSVFAKSRRDGGQATEARWTLLSPENAEFSPTTSQEAAPKISYTVTNAPKGGQVKVTVKFTSTAGVGEKSWTQPTEPGINHISGTFTQREDESGSIFEWTGKVEFDRSTEAFMGGSDGQYKLAPANYTVTASGNAGYFSPALSSCSMSGSGQFALSPEDSGFFVLPRIAETDPYPYTFTIQPAAGAELTYPIAITCPNPEDSTSTEWFGSFTASPLNLQNSADGIDYTGSEMVEEPTYTKTLEWSFHGTE
jgi:hypothetical protein